MIVRSLPQGPVIFAIRFLDRQITDAGKSRAHDAFFIELPILVAVGTKPVSRIVVPLIRKTNGDAVLGEGPQLLDDPVIQLLLPLAREEGDNFRPPIHKLRSIAPARIDGIAERN